MQYITQLALIHSTRAPTNTRSREQEQLYLQSHIFKEQPIRCFEQLKKHQSTSRRDIDCCILGRALLVEPIGIEPMTSCLQSRRSPN
jgi:hypothetical protein